MADKAKIAYISTLTERFRPDKIRVRQITVIDNIRAAAHGTKF
jgi:hypothetical protein